MRLAAVLLLAAACGSSTRALGPLRFHNAEPVARVNDRKPLPKPPTTFDTGLIEYYVKQDLEGPVSRALTIEESKPAANVNSLGEVPDSTWFTNRRLTPEQIRRGPGGNGPDRSAPWHVIGVKVGGAAIGITIEDARHDKYILKFDERGHPETETSADVVVQRLTYGFGYNVPDNNIVSFARADLVLDEKAEVKYRSGKKRPMTETDLEHYLSMGDSESGRYRVLASKMIDGKVLGGVEPSGTRQGDPNDRVPHELRRDLRGQRLLWAWVNHVDLKSQNTLATYTDDGFIKWYAIDFGESLGVEAVTTSSMQAGYQRVYSLTQSLLALVTFGLRVQAWERPTAAPKVRGLGEIDSVRFDPRTWIPHHTWLPVEKADRFDELWAAEILMRFTPDHIAAAVDAGQYTDRRARDYLVKTLVERQQIIGRYAFSRVAPLVTFDARSHDSDVDVCFDDLWLTYHFGHAEHTRYRTHTFDYDGQSLGNSAWKTAGGARSCLRSPAASTHDGYTIIRIDVERGHDDKPPIFVHVARSADGPRVIGLDRR